MQLTNCFYYGQDCSECDDADGVPECFKSRTETCPDCGRSFDIDVGCIPCEQRSEWDDDIEDDDDIAEMAKIDPIGFLLGPGT